MTEQLAFGSQQLMIVVLEHIAHSIATGSVVHFRSHHESKGSTFNRRLAVYLPVTSLFYRLLHKLHYQKMMMIYKLMEHL